MSIDDLAQTPPHLASRLIGIDGPQLAIRAALLTLAKPGDIADEISDVATLDACVTATRWVLGITLHGNDSPTVDLDEQATMARTDAAVRDRGLALAAVQG